MEQWTSDLVGSRLVEAFRELPGHPVFSAGADDLRPLYGSLSGLDLLTAATRLLERRRRERLALFSWARAQSGGASVAEVCRELGWPRSAFEKRRRRGAEMISDGINAVIALTEPRSLTSGKPPPDQEENHRGAP